ncbi:hypothetical protein ABPG74_005235 [Tetrahymena malaccensis]
MMKLKQNEESFLEQLDIFGIGINIRFSQKDEHTTRFGGLITISIVITMIIQIKLILNDFLDQSNPTLLYEQNYIQSPGQFYLSADQFSLAFGLQDLITGQFIESSFFSVSLVQNVEEKNINSTTLQSFFIKSQKQVKIKTCEADDFQIEETKQFFQSLDLKHLFCIEKSEEVYIQGQKGSDKYAWLQIIIQSCDNQNSCNISQYPYNKLVIYYSDNVVIPSSKSKPIQPIGTEVFWNSSINLSKQLSLLFRDTLIQTDTGFLLSDLNFDNKFKASQQNLQTTDLIDNVLYDLTISMEQNFQDLYKRSYQKIDKSFSQIGGTFNILFTIGALICKPISQLDLNRKLINNIFNFQDQEDQGNGQKEKQEKIQDLSDNNQNSVTEKSSPIQIPKQQIRQMNKSTFANYCEEPDSIKEGFTQNKLQTEIKQVEKQQNDISSSPIASIISSARRSITNKRNVSNLNQNQRNRASSFQMKSKEQTQSIIINSNDNNDPFSNQSISKGEQAIPNNIQKEELDKFFNQKKNNISYSTWDYFINFFKISNICRTRRQKLLQKGVDKFYSHIDIFYLIQKLLEVEKLKYLLLNENQIKLFEFIPKPLLTLKDKKNIFVSDKVGILYQQQITQDEKVNQAIEAFSHIVNSQEKISKIDIRIMELLDPKFKNYVKQVDNLEQQIEFKTKLQTKYEFINSRDYGLNKRTSIEKQTIQSQNNSQQEATSEMLIQEKEIHQSNNFQKYLKQAKQNQINILDKVQHK